MVGLQLLVYRTHSVCPAGKGPQVFWTSALIHSFIPEVWPNKVGFFFRFCINVHAWFNFVEFCSFLHVSELVDMIFINSLYYVNFKIKEVYFMVFN